MNTRRATKSGFSSGGSSSIMRSTMNLCASKPQAVAGCGDDNTTTTRTAARHIYGLSYLLQLLCRPAVGARARVAVIVEPDARQWRRRAELRERNDQPAKIERCAGDRQQRSDLGEIQALPDALTHAA